MRIRQRHHRQLWLGVVLGLLLSLVWVHEARAFVYWANLGGSGTTIGRAGDVITPNPPVPDPKPAAPPTIDKLVTGLPSTKRCLSRRSFTIRFVVPKGLTITKASVYVNGNRVAVRSGARLRSRVNLKGLPKGRYTVKIKLRTSAGKTITGTRKYRTCAPRKKGH